MFLDRRRTGRRGSQLAVSTDYLNRKDVENGQMGKKTGLKSTLSICVASSVVTLCQSLEHATLVDIGDRRGVIGDVGRRTNRQGGGSVSGE